MRIAQTTVAESRGEGGVGHERKGENPREAGREAGMSRG